jgi:hypothetical protein
MDSIRRRLANTTLFPAIRKPKGAGNTLPGVNGTGTRAVPLLVGSLEVGIQNHACDKSFPFFLAESLAAFDLAAIGLAIADRSGRLLLANRVAEDILASRDGLEITSAKVLRIVQRKGSATRGPFDRKTPAERICSLFRRTAQWVSGCGVFDLYFYRRSGTSDSGDGKLLASRI